MDYEDFIKKFRSLAIAEINDDSSYVYWAANDTNNEGVYFSIDIVQDGLYTLQMDKTPERMRKTIKRGYRYPEGRFEIAKIEGNRIKFY